MVMRPDRFTESAQDREIWCRRSGKAEIWDAEQGWVLKEPVMETVPDSQGRGLKFLCMVAAPHQHQWGDVQP